MARFDSYPAVVRRLAAATPDRVAVRFHRSGETADEVLSYGELDDAARRIGSWLQQRCEPGDRVLLSFQPGTGFIQAFLGCLYAAIVPVPVPVPGLNQAERTAGVALDAEPQLVLTDSASQEPLWKCLTATGIETPVHTVAELTSRSDPSRFTEPELTPQTLAFLQYTSGSTSDPKGVMVPHGALVHNVAMMCRNHGWSSDSVFCSWLPVYHDMGLIAMTLTPLYLGATTILLAPNDFLKRPATWLRLIHKYRATVSCAPNFAYDLCARRLSDVQIAGLDLSCWTHACNGAEPIDAATLELFANRFAATGFRRAALLPGYGLAEATLFVSGAPVASPPLVTPADPEQLGRGVLSPARPAEPARLLVSCGVVDGLDVRIIDPDTRGALPEGAVGEIWVRGPSVAAGYWARPEETGQAFGAVTDAGEGGFLRTGDLGALRDGELYVTGRRKEMFVVHGRNLYPHDIERELRLAYPETFDGLPAAAFSVALEHEEIVIVQEVRARGSSADELATLARTVKSRLSAALGVRVSGVVLVRVGQVRRTTSGKIRRTLMRDLFLSDALRTVHEELDGAVRTRFRPSLIAAGGSR